MASKPVTIIINAKNLASNVINGVKNQLQGLRGAGKEAGDALGGMKGALATLGLAAAGGAVARFVFNVNREFGKLRAQLRTLEGSDTGAAQVFAQIQDFAAKTPFQINEVTQAYITLRSSGIQPTEDMMNAFGDIAAGRSKNITDFAAAVQDAVTGEMERLKEFGITSRQQGDSIAFTFNGTTTVVKRNAKAVTDYLQGLGQSPFFKGGMANQMKTLEGSVSNFMDAMETAARTVGEGGFTTAVIGAITQVQGFVTELTTSGTAANDTAMQWVDVFKVVGGAIAWVVSKTIEGFGNILSWTGPFLAGIKMLGASIYGVFAKIPLALSDLWEGMVERTTLRMADFLASVKGAFHAVGIDIGDATIASLRARAHQSATTRAGNQVQRTAIDEAVRETQDSVMAEYSRTPTAQARNWGSGPATAAAGFGQANALGGRHKSAQELADDARKHQIEGYADLNDAAKLQEADLTRLVALHQALAQELEKENNVARRGELTQQLQKIQAILADPNQTTSRLKVIQDAARDAISEFDTYVGRLTEGVSQGLATRGQVAELERYMAAWRDALQNGNLPLEKRIQLTNQLRDAQDALLKSAQKLGSFEERMGATIRMAVGELETMEQVVYRLGTETFQAFEDAVANAFQMIVEGSKGVGAAFAAAMLHAVGAIARGMGDFYIAKAVGALGEGLLGDPKGFAAAAKFAGAATLFYALAGSVAGFANNVGGSGSGGGGRAEKRTEQVADKRGEAYITVEGGLLDMSDPRQAEALANALENLTDRRVIIQASKS
jgi:hypothetical protein